VEDDTVSVMGPGTRSPSRSTSTFKDVGLPGKPSRERRDPDGRDVVPIPSSAKRRRPLTAQAATELQRSLSCELREVAGGVVALIDAMEATGHEQERALKSLRGAADRLVCLVERMEAVLLEPTGRIVGIPSEAGARTPPARCALADLLGDSDVERGVVIPINGRFTVGELIVDLDAQEVAAGDRSTRPPGSLVRLLGAMAANPGRLFSRDEIRSSLWGHRRGSPSALHAAINRVRHILADELGTEIEIETVRAGGYRLTPPT
jgi:DNA-binding winged helix-turn-helix (wHTH) protein